MPSTANILPTTDLPAYSYEFFPPRTSEQAENLGVVVTELAATKPNFFSITCGAMGSTREATAKFAIEHNGQWPFPTMPHVTCVGQSRAEITQTVDAYAKGGIRNILALRGDGDAPGAFPHAIGLVEFIRDRYPSMSIGVAAHPEGHPARTSLEADRQYLADKLEAADFGITQFFLHPDHYHKLVNDLDALDCRQPVIPGVMLFASAAGLIRMAKLNKTNVPVTLAGELDRLSAPDDVGRLAVETAAQLIGDLDAEYKLPGVHIYTLNRSRPALALHARLPQRFIG